MTEHRRRPKPRPDDVDCEPEPDGGLTRRDLEVEADRAADRWERFQWGKR